MLPLTANPRHALVVLAVLIPFTLWTVWKLGFRRNASLDQRIYTVGVQGFGLTFWVGFSLILCFGVLDNASLPLRILVTFTILPLALWGGYLWGRIMIGILAR